jgi:dynein intermediate chain 2
LQKHAAQLQLASVLFCCREKGSETLLGGVSLEYDPAAGPTKFMVGCEQGSVLSCNRKAKNPADRVGSSYAGHHGPVYGLKR